MAHSGTGSDLEVVLLLQYSVLITLLAEAGYTVISTPYAVTFKHTDCAGAVQEVSTAAEMHCSGSLTSL